MYKIKNSTNKLLVYTVQYKKIYFSLWYDYAMLVQHL